jgi:heme exporter protein A
VTSIESTTLHQLKARKIGFTVGRRQLLSDVNLSCGSGQWIQVTGANGVGKSSLLRLLVGLAEADTGCVEFFLNGTLVKNHSASLLYQGHLHGFKDQLTVEENLRLQINLDASRYDITNEQNAHLTAAIEIVGLSSRRHLAVGKLSAGQKRRCMLARLAFAVSLLNSVKRCWVLDEPVTALDSQAQALLGQLLKQHLDQGGSAILATHQDLTSLGLPAPTELNLSAPSLSVPSIPNSEAQIS